MSFLRFTGILITLAVALTSCSPRVSQIEYDRKNYEYEQLKMRYELLKKEAGGDIVSTPITNNPQTQITSDISVADYEELKRNYATLMQQHTALETTYNELHNQQQIPKPIKKKKNAKSSKSDLAEYEALKQKHKILMQEHSALKIAYDELQEQPIEEVIEPTKVTSDINVAEHEELKQNYATLMQQHATLEAAYNKLHQEQQQQPINPPGTVSKTTYTTLQTEKTELERRYAILENRYNALKRTNSDASSIGSAEIIAPTEINPDLNIGKGNELEENSIDLGTMVVQSASHNGLFFDFDAYDRTEEYLVLEIAVKNNSQNSLRTFWNADKIQIIDKFGNTYTANSFRVGVDYADINNTLLKRIKDENTVFARFAFEELPDDFKQIQSLKFIVIIEGEERAIEFTQINISEIEIE